MRIKFFPPALYVSHVKGDGTAEPKLQQVMSRNKKIKDFKTVVLWIKIKT